MKTETILIIVLAGWFMLGLAIPLPNQEPPKHYPQPQNLPGEALFMKDSQGETITWSMIETGYRPEHYELRP